MSRAIDPITGQGACAATPAADEPGTAAYRLPAATGKGYTLLGSPVLSARFAVTGREPALAARLWDVAPGGATQTLVARALYRPRPGKHQVFQLHPNGWRFAAGHVPKLELVGTRLALRPPVELRLVDRRVRPEAAPAGLREAERRRREVTEAPVQALAGVTFGWSPLRRAGAQDGAVSPRCPHRASS